MQANANKFTARKFKTILCLQRDTKRLLHEKLDNLNNLHSEEMQDCYTACASSLLALYDMNSLQDLVNCSCCITQAHDGHAHTQLEQECPHGHLQCIYFCAHAWEHLRTTSQI